MTGELRTLDRLMLPCSILPFPPVNHKSSLSSAPAFWSHFWEVTAWGGKKKKNQGWADSRKEEVPY